MKRGTITQAFRNLNNIKREITLHHPELFKNAIVMQNLSELELTIRRIQTDLINMNVFEDDK